MGKLIEAKPEYADTITSSPASSTEQIPKITQSAPTHSPSSISDRASTEAIQLAVTMPDHQHSGPAPDSHQKHISLNHTQHITNTDNKLFLGHFTILGILGRGGMGTVYHAHDINLDRQVAIKVINSQDDMMIARFIREARAQARIEHENICKIYETGNYQGTYYIAMQIINGEPLDKAAQNMTLADRVLVMRDVAKALDAAHKLNIVHRDIKPSNILIEKRVDRSGFSGWRPIIMDFGLARETNEGKGLTESGAVLGTPAYMSPEQARGDTRHIDHRSDIYSMGATLYDIISGHPPFEDESAVKIILKVMNETPASLRHDIPNIPTELDIIVSKCLNKEPNHRYATAIDLADDLDRYLRSKKNRATRISHIHRLIYLAKHNRALAMAALAFIFTVLTFIAYGIATQIDKTRADSRARAQARLAQELGQVIKEFELFMRAAYGLPTHDIRREQAVVRERMAALRQQLAEGSSSSLGALRYALGRGHLVLREFAVAQAELEQAWQAGYRSPETRLALGLALGERYRQELEQVRRASDRDWIRAQEQLLERRFLQPALAYLDGSQGRLEVPASVEGLIALYRKQYDLALRKAVAAQRQAPWLAEPIKLEGDVYQEQAIALRDRGEYKPAVEKLQQAIGRHQAAAQIHRSDASIHEAEAEDWLWWLTTKEQTGDPIADTAERATAACQRAMQADPLLVSVYQTQSAVYWRSAILAMMQNQSPIELVKKSIAASQQALQLDPNNWLSHYGIGSASGLLIQQQVRDSALDSSTVQTATQALQAAVRLNPNAHWAWNDLGMIFMFRMIYGLQRGSFDKDLFDSFVRAEEQSFTLRPDIATPLANLSYGSGLVADYHVSTGQSPDGFVAQAVKYAQRGQALNAADRDHLNNETTGHLVAATARILRGDDPTAELDTAQRLVDKSLSLNASYGETHQQAAAVQVQRATWALRSGKSDLAAEIAVKGLSAVDRGAQVSKDDPVLLGHRARLLATLGRANGREESLRAAREAAQQLVKQTPQAVDAQEALAETTRYLIEHLLAHTGTTLRSRTNIGPWLKEGLAACEAALLQNPNRASAFALRGALHLLQAQHAQAASERTQALSNARRDLQAALQRNPFLNREFAPLLTRVQSL